MMRPVHVHINEGSVRRFCEGWGMRMPSSIEISYDPFVGDDGREFRSYRGLYQRRVTKTETGIYLFVHDFEVAEGAPLSEIREIREKIHSTLMHELRHHWQYEFDRHNFPEEVRLPYHQRPHEIDAYAFANRMRGRYTDLLTVA